MEFHICSPFLAWIPFIWTTWQIPILPTNLVQIQSLQTLKKICEFLQFYFEFHTSYTDFRLPNYMKCSQRLGLSLLIFFIPVALKCLLLQNLFIIICCISNWINVFIYASGIFYCLITASMHHSAQHTINSPEILYWGKKIFLKKLPTLSGVQTYTTIILPEYMCILNIQCTFPTTTIYSGPLKNTKKRK